MRGLNARRIAAHVLVTEQSCDLVSITGMSIPGPADVPTALFPVEQPDSWGNHWAAMIRYLEDRGPCIYIPNHDWRHSCISPRLSRQVSVVGVVHSDDPLHYDHVARLGRFWDAIVTVSPTLQRKVTQLQTRPPCAYLDHPDRSARADEPARSGGWARRAAANHLPRRAQPASEAHSGSTCDSGPDWWPAEWQSS